MRTCTRHLVDRFLTVKLILYLVSLSSLYIIESCNILCIHFLTQTFLLLFFQSVNVKNVWTSTRYLEVRDDKLNMYTLRYGTNRSVETGEGKKMKVGEMPLLFDVLQSSPYLPFWSLTSYTYRQVFFYSIFLTLFCFF